MDMIFPSMEQSTHTPDADANDLLIFARVAEAGSFSRAAERLSLPKSTVSRRIALLEERLGERLMLRTTRRLTLTEFGEQLLAHARQVADEVDAVKALKEHRQSRPSGRLRVSMPFDFATLLVEDMLADFVQRYPDVSLALDLSPRRVDLLDENFDLAIRMGELPDDNLLAARRIAVLPSGLYASPDYVRARGEPSSPEALLDHDGLRLMARNGDDVIWHFTRAHKHWHGAAPARAVANAPGVLINLARAGRGIAAVPDYFAAPYVRSGELRKLLPEWQLPASTAWAVFPGRRLMPTKTRAFIDMLEAALAGMREVGVAGV
jgi:DNA-binding transcriptional LysR family regulator